MLSDTQETADDHPEVAGMFKSQYNDLREKEMNRRNRRKSQYSSIKALDTDLPTSGLNSQYHKDSSTSFAMLHSPARKHKTPLDLNKQASNYSTTQSPDKNWETEDVA